MPCFLWQKLFGFWVFKSLFLCLVLRWLLQNSSLHSYVANMLQFFGRSYCLISSLNLSKGSFCCQRRIILAGSLVFPVKLSKLLIFLVLDIPLECTMELIFLSISFSDAREIQLSSLVLVALLVMLFFEESLTSHLCSSCLFNLFLL